MKSARRKFPDMQNLTGSARANIGRCQRQHRHRHTLSRDKLKEHFAADPSITDRTIDVHISALRRKLQDDPKNPRFIRTVRAAGYMLIDQTDRERP